MGFACSNLAGDGRMGPGHSRDLMGEEGACAHTGHKDDNGLVVEDSCDDSSHSKGLCRVHGEDQDCGSMGVVEGSHHGHAHAWNDLLLGHAS